MNAASAGSGWMRARGALIAASLALTLAGCESGSSIFSSSGDQAGTALTDGSATPGSTQTSKFAVATVFGPPDAVSKQLQAQVVSSLERSKVTVAKAPTDKAEYTLRGYVVAARERTGTKVSYIWDVTDPAGKRVNRVTGEEMAPAAAGTDPWAAVTPQVVDNIVAKTTAPLLAWLPTQSAAGVPVAQSAPLGSAPAGSAPVGAAPAPTAGSSVAGGSLAAAPQATPITTPPQPGATPVAAAGPASAAGATPAAAPGPTTGSIGRPGAVSALVPTVAGAPGDGGISLTGAIQRELTKNGVQLASAGGGQVYKVEGKVAVGEVKDGKQSVNIDWHVKDPAGKKLGTVSQKNEVPQGSLDGAWGRTADAAAAAAAQGILKLLPQQTAQAAKPN